MNVFFFIFCSNLSHSVYSVSFDFLFFSSTVWWIYGILLDNIFIQLPNIPGVGVSVAALLVVWRLGDAKKVADPKKDN